MDIKELRFLGESSYDPYLIECFGVEALQEAASVGCLNELHTGAMDSIEHAFGAEVKKAKAAIKEAQSAVSRKDKKAAKKAVDEALKAIDDGRKKAEEIDDDGILENLVIGFLLGMLPKVGAIAASAGFYYEWYCLRTQADKGDTYSKHKPERRKNLILEAFFGKWRHAGYSRSAVLAGYDRMRDEVEGLKKRIDNMEDKK